MKVNWLQAAECFITCLLERYLSQKWAKTNWENWELDNGYHVFQEVRDSRANQIHKEKYILGYQTQRSQFWLWKADNSGCISQELPLPTCLILTFFTSCLPLTIVLRIPTLDLFSGPAQSLIHSLCCISRKVLWGPPWPCCLTWVLFYIRKRFNPNVTLHVRERRWEAQLEHLPAYHP